MPRTKGAKSKAPNKKGAGRPLKSEQGEVVRSIEIRTYVTPELHEKIEEWAGTERGACSNYLYKILMGLADNEELRIQVQRAGIAAHIL